MTAPPLYLLLRHARAELAAETPTALHTHHAPKLLDADGATTHYPDEGGVGLPFTAAFHRVLAYGERPRQPDTAVRYSLSSEVTAYCRVNHPEHVPPDQGKPLCAQMVYLAVWLQDEPDAIASITGRPEAQIRTLLVGALTHAAQWRAALYRTSGPVESATANETVEARLRREHDLAHEEATWRLHQRKYRLPDWPEELAERRARHKALRCEACPLLAEAA